MLPIAPDTLLQQRYRILNTIEEGDFRRTYLATDIARVNSAGRNRAEEHCAIEEFIPSDQFPTVVANAKEFFKQEATLLYQLQHPQIPRFWAIFEERDRLFLVRDYVDGQTYGQILTERLESGKTFSEAEVWQFLLQALPAIGYIHSKGVIHRDLTPDSIMLRDRDRLTVLTNFGVVKEFAQRLHAHPTNQKDLVVGQPGYAPPEQLNHGQLNPHSDLYTLAVTAIVLLTGKSPSALFEGDRINWEWRKWTQISDGFAEVLRKMLNPVPTDRYQSAIEVDRALQALQITPDRQFSAASAAKANRTVELPTIAVGNKPMPSVTNRVQSAITNLNVKSAWEKPQVFIPVGILIALLAGVGSWFGVTHLLHRQPSEPVASTPPKQIDFNNPTIPTDNNPNPNSGDTIQPTIDRPVIKEGTVDTATPVRYKIAAVGGQNLDIQLVPMTSQGVDPSKTPLPIDGSQPTPTPTGAVSPIAPIPSPGNPKTTKIPTGLPQPLATPQLVATQVLMTILSPAGTPIDAQADRVVGWRGPISTTGDYTIELRPIQGLSGKSFPYKLSVNQLAAIPTPFPSPAAIDPSSGSPPPLGIPIPIGGNGIQPIPANPQTNPNLPIVTPSPVPIEVPKTRIEGTPSETERPIRKRRVRRDVEPNPEVKERRRARSTDEDTPTPRRRVKRTDADAEETPTPRRRRRNRPTEESQPKRTPEKTPDPENTDTIVTPKSEPPPIPIKVPAPNNSSPSKTDGDNGAVPSGNGANDPN